MLPSSVAMSSVIAKEDYKLGASLAVTGIVILAAPWLPGGFFLLLGAFLLFQTLRIRFVFDEDAFEVQTKPLDDLFSNDLTNTGENFAVGVKRRASNLCGTSSVVHLVGALLTLLIHQSL